MSLSDRNNRPSRRWALRTAGCLALGGWLAGCGFQPLYARRGEAGVSNLDDLRAIRIDPLEGRAGQIFHNYLRDRLNPLGQPARPLYVLDVTLNETTRELALRDDETATRADLSIVAVFKLTKPGETQVLFSGSSRAVNSYNILQSQFATQTSEQDARKRALRELSDEVQAQLGIYFSRQAGT